MKLNDKFSLEQEGFGFVLIEKTVIKVTKDGKKTGETKDGKKKRFYGSVYQALHGFLKVSVDSCIKNGTDIVEEVDKVLHIIDQANKLIKDEFCIEVKSVKP